MALRASRNVSSRSLQSKFASYAKNAETYKASEMANQYANGQITAEEYKSFLNGRLSNISKGTSSYLSVSKQLKSVETDIQQNTLATKVSLGLEDPAKLADVISQRVVDEGILEGTPEYNSILKQVVNLKDQSVNYEKKQKYREYQQMKLENASMADKFWDDYLQTLPGRMSSQIAVENAQYESESFHTTRIKSEIARAIKQTSDELKRAGVEGSAFHAAMRDTYAEASSIAADNGLTEYANTLDNYAFTSNQNYQNASEGEMGKAGKEEVKLASAQEWDIRQRIKDAEKAGDLEGLKTLYNELGNNLNLQVELNNKIGEYDNAAQISAKLEPAQQAQREVMATFTVGEDGKITPRENADGTVDMPQAGDFVMVRDNQGNLKPRKIDKLNADGTFESQGWTKDQKQMVVDPKTGFLNDISESDVEVGKDANGQPIIKTTQFVQGPDGSMNLVGKDKDGNNKMLGEEIAPGIYRMVKNDGGYNFTTFDGEKAETIDAYKASELAQKPVKDMLAGSNSKEDQKTIARVGEQIITPEIRKALGIQDTVSGLNSSGAKVVNDLLANSMEKKKQDRVAKEAETARVAAEAAKAAADASKLPSPVNALGGVTVEAPAPTPIAGNTGIYVAPTELLAPTPVPTQSRPAANQPIDPANAAALMRRDVIAKGYTRQRKPDGGWDFIKEGFGAISVDDLARETGTIKDKLLDPNAKSFKLF